MNVEELVRLARGYVFERAGGREVYPVNAEVIANIFRCRAKDILDVYHAGKEQAALAWLPMGSLLSDIVPPPTPPPTPLVLAHTISAPGIIQAEKHRPTSESTGGRAFLGARLQGECASFWT